MLANVVNIFQAVRNYGNRFTSSYEEYNQELQNLQKDLFRANKIVYDLVEKMNTLTKYEKFKLRLMEEIQESKEREKNKVVNKTIENKIQIKKSSHFNSRTSPLSQNLKTAVNHFSAKKQEKVLVEMVYYMVNSLSTIYYIIYNYYCRYCFLLLTVSIQALSKN